MTKGILKSVQRKNQLYKRYLLRANRKNEIFYKKYKNKLNHLIKHSKKTYYEQQFIKHKQNTKMTWRTLNELLNKPRRTTELPKEFIENNSPNSIADPTEIANKFNNYFLNLGPKLANKIRNSSNNTFEKYLTDANPNSMFLSPIYEYEVETEIKSLNASKSSGYDGYSAKILKDIYKEISKPLTHIFNQLFITGFIPDQMKIALVTPIFNANEENKFENYRPISVLTCFAKIFEKLMYKSLINFIEKNGILSKHQYGFRKNRSTEHAMIEMVDKIMKAIDQGKYTVGVFLDLSKAFDTIDHRILIRKLEYYGIRGITKSLFENYLKYRKQIVKYNSVQSTEKTILTGVLQGSILGPLQFILYIDHIQNCREIVSILLFADDTNILYSHSCLKTLNVTLQTEMNKIAEGLNLNKLSINTTKTKLVLFRSPNKKKNEMKLFINNQHIIQLKNTTFLGVVLDEYLTWKDHINLITKKVIKSAGIITNIRHYTNLNTLKLIYYALVYQYLIYGNLLWGNTYKSRIQKLINVQKNSSSNDI
jgi:hypothetical protein